MSQHSFNIADEAGAAFLADVNTALQALASQSAGATEPSTKYAYQVWLDTTTGFRKQRNSTNAAWITKELITETFAQVAPICGRLTLSSGVPVTQADVTGATTVFFTPYLGAVLELYDGTNWNRYQGFSELSQATTDSTKSPAAVAVSSNYDVFVWSDSGTLRATRGPLWSSDTARGTGAGTTELILQDGRYVNKVAITNGPGAKAGLYVGTIRSDGSSQINDAAAGKRHVWNYYNRKPRPIYFQIGTNSWTYAVDTWRASNGSSANSVTWVCGIAEDGVSITMLQQISQGSGLAATIGVGIDSTSANSAQLYTEVTTGTSIAMQQNAFYSGVPSGIGLHTGYMLERARAGTVTFNGNAGDANHIQAGLVGMVQG